MLGARFVATLTLVLAGCGSAFESLPTADRSAYFRCASSMRATLCGGRGGGTACTDAHEPEYAALPDRARRRWLAAHGCAGAVVYRDEPTQTQDVVSYRPARSAFGWPTVVASSPRRGLVLALSGHVDAGEEHAHLTVARAPGATRCTALTARVDGVDVPLPRGWSKVLESRLEMIDSTVPLATLDRIAAAREVELRACDRALTLDERQLAMLHEFLARFRAELAPLPPPPPDVVGTVTVTSVTGLPDVRVGSTCTLRVRASDTAGRSCRASLACGDVAVYARPDHPHFVPCTTLSLSPPVAIGGEGESTSRDGDPTLGFDSAQGSIVVSDDVSGELGVFTLQGQLVVEGGAP